MRFRTRLAIFVLTALTTFTIGVFIAPLGRKQVGQPCKPIRWRASQLRELNAWQVLLSFQNRDLKRLDEESERTLRQAIDTVRGKPDSDNVYPAFMPRLFQLVSNTQGEPRYVLVEEAPLVIIPGSSELRIHVFDVAGRLLNAEEFSAYRTIFTSIRIRKVVALLHEVLIVDTDYCLGGHKTREFYGLVGNRIAPVYVEADGRFDPTESTTAPRMKRSLAKWELALHSEDDVEVLSALLWFGANRWTGRPTAYDANEGLKVTDMLLRKDIRARLETLSESANPWVSTAARWVLNPD